MVRYLLRSCLNLWLWKSLALYHLIHFFKYLGIKRLYIVKKKNNHLHVYYGGFLNWPFIKCNLLTYLLIYLLYYKENVLYTVKSINTETNGHKIYFRYNTSSY